MKCDACGVSSDSDVGYVRVSTGGWRRKTLCATCAEYEFHSTAGRELRDILVYGGFLVVVVLLFPDFFVGWLVINLCLFYLVTHLVVIIHELGHAFGAWLTGTPLYMLSFGRGRRLWSGR